MIDKKELLNLLKAEHQVDEKQEKNYNSVLVSGIVVDTDDPLEMGRLRVFCPSLNDDPAKLQHLPWASYLSPLGGVISNAAFARGAGKHPENSVGATSYGWWGIPEQGATVLVACVEGDERRRVWVGCLPAHQETHTLMHGRFDWSSEDGTPDGPLTSSGNPLEPLYSTAEKAFAGKKDSPEWKTRQAEYQAAAINKTAGEDPNDVRGGQDDQYPDISEAEQDDWVKGRVGSHGYDWSGHKGLGAFKSSRVYGFSTPGGHAISMDDRPFNSRIRIRSATGHQIILDDTNERIYMSTNEGASWIELDSNGNIDIFAERRVSVHAEKDINFTTDESFRVKAKKGIYMYAGDKEGQSPLDSEKPEDGEIRFHSTSDMHVFSEKNLRILAAEDMLTEVGGKSAMSIAEEMLLQVDSGVDIIVNDGDYNLSVNGDYSHHASGDNSMFAGDNTRIQAVSDVEMFSYSGAMDIGAQLDINMKSYESNITVESLHDNVLVMGNEGNSQMEAGSDGVTLFSTDAINVQTKEEYNVQCFEGFGVDEETKTPTLNGLPISSGCIFIPGALNVSFKENEIDFGIDGDVNLDVGDTVKTSVRNINAKFAQIEDRFNDAIGTLHQFVGETLSFLGSSGTPSFPFSPSIPLPTFPAINFNLGVPALELPDFNFDFCVNIDPLIQVPNYNPFPDGSFINVNADLGGWTKNSLRNWTRRQQSNFTNSVNGLQFAVSASIASVPNTITQVKNNVTNIRNSLDNLVNVNVTDNGLQLINYTAGVNDLLGEVSAHNASVEAHNLATGEEVPKLEELENQLTIHSRRVNELVNQVNQNPTAIDSIDFEELELLLPLWEEFFEGLEDIV